VAFVAGTAAEGGRVSLHLHSRLSTVGANISDRLRYGLYLVKNTGGPSPRFEPLIHELATGADVYDAIGLLREGVVVGTSRFKIEGFGPVSFNVVVDWLEACGYPVAGLRVPVRKKRVLA
jgi:hypothetical protein